MVNASARLVLVCALGLVVLLAVAARLWVIPRFRVHKSELERRRRLFVNSHGRIRDAMVTDFKDDFLFYTYSISRVQYNASQDVSSLRELLPRDPIGAAAIKYSLHNPANSIVVCEHWSGLRGGHAGASPDLKNNEERSLST
jgi:hypothetical protein